MSSIRSKQAKAICVLYDLRDPEACELLHKQQAAWQKCSDMEPLDENHTLLIIRPGGAISEEAGREAT